MSWRHTRDVKAGWVPPNGPTTKRQRTSLSVSDSRQNRIRWPGTIDTVLLDHDRCYRAISSRDARFDGCFVVAVRTTGIYCRPSCPR